MIENALILKLVEEKMRIDEHNENLAEGEEKQTFDKAAELAKLNMKIQARKQAALNAQKQLNKEIDERITKQAFEANGYDFDTAKGDTVKDKIDYVSTLDAQMKYKDELKNDLEAQIGAASEEADIIKTGKIGATEVNINKDAIVSQASAQMQLSDLNNNNLLEDENVYNKEAQEIAKKVEYQRNNSAYSDDITAAKNRGKQAYKIDDKTERKAKVQETKQAIKDAKTTHKQGKKDTKQASSNAKKSKRENGQYIAGTVQSVSVSDQITQMVKQRESEKRTATTSSRSNSSVSRQQEVKNENTNVDSSTDIWSDPKRQL